MNADTKLKLKELFIEVDAAYADLSFKLEGGTFCLDNLGISPVEFLTQAELDFQHETLTASANCLSNAKRAITGQIDQVLISIGHSPYRWDLPKKLNKIKEIGILTPSALRKLIKARNILEHEYSAPGRVELEDFLDLAALFVLGTSAQFHPFSDELTISFAKNDGEIVGTVEAGIFKNNGSTFYVLFGKKLVDGKENFIGRSDITAEHPLFAKLMKLCSSIELNYKVKETSLELEAEIRSILRG